MANEYGLKLYDYQNEILNETGHRVMVGGRQVGKTTTAAIEAQVKSKKGKVLSYITHNDRILRGQYGDRKNITNFENRIPNDIREYDYLVVGEAKEIPSGILNPKKILRNFSESLICGTPTRRKLSFHSVVEDKSFNKWKIPMRKCPFIDDDSVDFHKEIMDDGLYQREVEGKFTND